jgi:hypothetical protein
MGFIEEKARWEFGAGPFWRVGLLAMAVGITQLFSGYVYISVAAVTAT